MKYILFTGGGSAGHVVPNLAVMQELRSACKLAYMGTNGMERALVAAFGCPYYAVDCPKLIRAPTPKNLAIPFRLVSALKKAHGILQREAPDLVFSKGGYASYPAIWAAHRLRIPVLTHESDLSPGLCTRLAAKKCRYVLTSFPETAKKFGNGRCVGSPIRRDVLRGDRAAARVKYRIGHDKPVLLVLGGGSGSRVLNEAVRGMLSDLLPRFDILHLCGKGNLADMAQTGYVQREYETDMASAYACADIALSRAGSNTVFELLALQKPVLLVPLERASRGDQLQNARYFAERELCCILREGELADLPAALLRLYGNAKVRAALRLHAPASGTEQVLSVIREVLEDHAPPKRSPWM